MGEAVRGASGHEDQQSEVSCAAFHSGMLQLTQNVTRGAAPLYTKLWRAEYVPPPHYSLGECSLGDKAGSKLAEVLPHTKLVNLK